MLSIEFHARSDNANSVYWGRSDVTSTNGRELAPGEAVPVNFGTDENGKPGSVLFNRFYVTVTGSDKIDWTVITAES